MDTRSAMAKLKDTSKEATGALTPAKMKLK